MSVRNFYGSSPSQIVTRQIDGPGDRGWVACSGRRFHEEPGSIEEIAFGPTEIDAVYNLGYMVRDLEASRRPGGAL